MAAPHVEALRRTTGQRKVTIMSDSMLNLWTNDHDTVVAADAADAHKVWCEYMGEEIGAHEADVWAIDTRQSLTISGEWAGGSVTLTAAEWCAKNGRGFLCSASE